MGLVLLLGTAAFPLLLAGITQGSDGAQLSGGGCGNRAAPAQNDADADGIEDSLDNCPSSFNPSQTDSDANGIGEICESVEAFDGVIECPFPACASNDDCLDFLAESCPEDNIELSMLGATLDCCDQACVVMPNPEEGICPAGSCPAPFLHCTGDEECQDAGFDVCFEGCCFGGEEEPEP
ncbi:MAG TPA: thrombospondin type 3 repeat-containing protein, partial [bacterium]|nr:thrombospondin type 3 repeat-containing protein [bacterium]